MWMNCEWRWRLFSSGHKLHWPFVEEARGSETSASEAIPPNATYNLKRLSYYQTSGGTHGPAIGKSYSVMFANQSQMICSTLPLPHIYSFCSTMSLKSYQCVHISCAAHRDRLDCNGDLITYDSPAFGFLIWDWMAPTDMQNKCK